MRRFVYLALVPLLINVLQVESKRTISKKLLDRPHSEFISLGSMDEITQASALIENIRVSRLNVSLEKLVEKFSQMRSNPQLLVQHLEKVKIQAPSTSTVDSGMYKKSVEILKRIAPNLETVTLIGGHMFKPSNENRPDTIKEEILFMRNYLKTIINTFEAQNITVKDVRFIVGIIVPDKTQAQIDFGRLIRSTFGYQPNQEELDTKTVGMVVQMNKTTCYLGVGVNPSKQEDGWMTPTSIIAVGRSAFQEQVILTNFKKEWYTRVLDLINSEPSQMHAKHRVNDLSRRRLFTQSTSLDDSNVKAVGRTNDLPRRLFASQRDMDFNQFQQPPQLQLEEFFDKHVDSIKVENLIENLGLRVSVQNNRSGVTPSRMYKVAVENLKKLVPNLKKVTLYGGYVFQPKKPTRDTVQNELEFLAQNVREWIDAFGEANITVVEIRFVATFVVSNKVRETSQYAQALKSIFHYTPTQVELDQNAVRMRLEFGKVPCRLGLHFRDTDRDQTFCPSPLDRNAERYSQFNYFCSEKRPMRQWYMSIWSDQQFSW